MKKLLWLFLISLVLMSCTANRRPPMDMTLSFTAPPYYSDFNAEDYNIINENEFLDASTNPLSTFSIDVDAASYSNVRRFIRDNQFPPTDAVRIEELINYFSYDYPEPDSGRPFSVNTEVSDCPWAPSHYLVHIGLQGKHIPVKNLPPSNIIFLLDVSGSMDMPAKLPLLKSAFNLLVEQLREQDRVGIIVYAGAAGEVLPSTEGSHKEKIRRAIDKLQAGGSTAGAAGIELAYQRAAENYIENGNNRVILATDGDFNVGTSGDAELVRLIEQEREKGIFLSVLGFGTGNLKDSKMEQLADKGNGNYSYIDNILEAKKVLVSEMGATLFTIAKDVKLQVEFNPAKVGAYRLIGYENRLLAKEDFKNDKKDAGELGAGHSVTALYEVIPVGQETGLVRVDSLRYQTVGIKPEALSSQELMSIKLRYKNPDDTLSNLMERVVPDSRVNLAQSSDDFRFSASVAEFGMLLRNSKFKGDATYSTAIDLANGARGVDKEGYRTEFVSLVEACGLLKKDYSREKGQND